MTTPPAITARACTSPEEMRRAASCIAHYFGGRLEQAWVDRWLTFADFERMHAAFEGEAIVGGAGAFSLELTVPGGVVPAGGVTVVGVLPTHRRRGALTAMMRAQLDDVRRRGEPIACLWASEGTIYERFGYGLSVSAMEVTVPRAHTAFREPFAPVGRARIVTTEEALAMLPGIYDRVRVRTPGMLSRTPAWWKSRRMLDVPERRGGGGVLEHMVLEIDGEPEAYALYRMHFRLEHDTPAGKVDVLEVIGATPDAVRSILRLLLDIDWTAAIHFPVMPVDHPLRLLLQEPRRATFHLYDTLWVRLVDVAAALSARSYASDDAVVLDVRDAFCAWNAGRYRVSRTGVARTDEPADLSLDVSDAGAVFLGGFTFRELFEAGRIVEHRGGALVRADGLFRVDRAPYNPEMF